MNNIVYSTDPKVRVKAPAKVAYKHSIRNHCIQAAIAENHERARKVHAQVVSEYRKQLAVKAARLGMTLEGYCTRFNINIMKDISA